MASLHGGRSPVSLCWSATQRARSCDTSGWTGPSSSGPPPMVGGTPLGAAIHPVFERSTGRKDQHPKLVHSATPTRPPTSSCRFASCFGRHRVKVAAGGWLDRSGRLSSRQGWTKDLAVAWLWTKEAAEAVVWNIELRIKTGLHGAQMPQTQSSACMVAKRPVWTMLFIIFAASGSSTVPATGSLPPPPPPIVTANLEPSDCDEARTFGESWRRRRVPFILLDPSGFKGWSTCDTGRASNSKHNHGLFALSQLLTHPCQ
jgi:hypothetical protein